MSPEQCLGQPVSFASDQYAVGLIAYELLVGLPPFLGYAVEVQRAHLREAPVWVGFARRDCPTPLAAAVMRMLAKEPNERWPSLRAVAPLIAASPRKGPAVRQAALARLVRDVQSAQPSIARPRPVAWLEVTPQPSALDIDPRQAPRLLTADKPRTRLMSRRFVMTVGLAAAILATAWVEAVTLARKPNVSFVGAARVTSGPAGSPVTSGAVRAAAPEMK